MLRSSVLLLATGCIGLQAHDRDFGVQSDTMAPLEAFPDARVDGEGEVTMLLPGGIETVVPYALKDGWAVAGGDLVLGPASDITDRSVSVGWEWRLWDSCEIPYSLDESLSYAARQDFLSAVEHYADETAIRFVEDDEATNRIHVEGGDACYAWLGSTELVTNKLVLAPNCGRGAAIHELGHALGLLHEQTRSDSEDHVLKNLENVDWGDRINFYNWTSTIQGSENHGEYDFGSIMHYSSGAFSNSTCTPSDPSGCSLTHLDGSYISEHQRSGLSDRDRAAIQSLYGDQCGWEPEPETLTANLGGSAHTDAYLSAGRTDTYAIEVTGTGTLTVHTTGETDTYGTLLDPSDSTVSSDDDSGEGTNFSMSAAVTPGTWLVEVRGYNDSTAGDYTLRVALD